MISIWGLLGFLELYSMMLSNLSVVFIELLNLEVVH
jgi:hypothetical protein